MNSTIPAGAAGVPGGIGQMTRDRRKAGTATARVTAAAASFVLIPFSSCVFQPLFVSYSALRTWAGGVAAAQRVGKAAPARATTTEPKTANAAVTGLRALPESTTSP